MKHWNKKIFVIACNEINKKVPATSNPKEHYKSLLKNKNKKLVKQSTIITQRPKTIENSNILDTKSFTMERPKTSHRLSETEGGEKDFLSMRCWKKFY